MSTSRPYPRRRLSSSYGYRRRALRVVRTTHRRPFVTPTVEDDSDDDSSSASSCYTSSSDSFFDSSSDSSSDDDAEPVAQVVPPQLAAARRGHTTMDSSRRASAIRLTLTDSSDDDDDSSSHHSSSSSDTFMSASSSSDDSDDAPLSSRRSSSVIRALEQSSRYDQQDDEWSRLVGEVEQHMEATRRLAVEMQRVIMSQQAEDDRLTRLRMTRMQHDSRRLSIVMEMQAETQRRLAESSERRQHAMSLAVPFGSADDRMSRRGGVVPISGGEVHIPEQMRYPVPPDDVPARRRQVASSEVHIPEHMRYPVPPDDVPARRQVASGGEGRIIMADLSPREQPRMPRGGTSSSQTSSSSRVVPFGTADDSTTRTDSTTRPARVTWEDQVHPTRNVSANDQVGLFTSPWEELVSVPFGNTETTISEAHFLDAMQQSVRRHRNRQERTLRTAQAVSQAVANLLLYGSSDDEDDVFSSSDDDEVTQRVTTLQVAWSELGVDLAVAQSVTCSICLENAPSNLSKINCCNHLFCHECIHTWSERQNTCPLCKRRFAVITHAMRQQQETVTS